MNWKTLHEMGLSVRGSQLDGIRHPGGIQQNQ